RRGRPGTIVGGERAPPRAPQSAPSPTGLGRWTLEVRCSMLDARWWHSGWFRLVRVFGGSIGFSGFNSFDLLLPRRSHAHRSSGLTTPSPACFVTCTSHESFPVIAILGLSTTLPTSAGHAAKTAPPSLLDNRLLDSPLATSPSRHSDYQRHAAPHSAFCHSAGFRSRTVWR